VSGINEKGKGRIECGKGGSHESNNITKKVGDKRGAGPEVEERKTLKYQGKERRIDGFWGCYGRRRKKFLEEGRQFQSISVT